MPCSHRPLRYTLLTFLPRNLFEQFHRLANVYFLFIACLNWVPAVQAFGKEISFIPLLFVLAVTALKDAYEDRRRARSDREVNNSTAEVLRHGKWTKQPWAKVQVGDLIRVLQNEAIPADMVLLHASSHEDKTGFCYIETANLDGETNLKQRQMYTEWTPEFDPTAFSHSVTCEAPNVKIYQFNGQAVVNPTTRLPLDKENFLLRGCVVRNTKAVVGIVTYAGHDTKAMMNNTGPRSKISLVRRAREARRPAVRGVVLHFTRDALVVSPAVLATVAAPSPLVLPRAVPRPSHPCPPRRSWNAP